MIQITAYLRDEEDLNKWKAIGNKTQFLHDAIQVQDSTLHSTMYPKEIGNKLAPDILDQKYRYGVEAIDEKEFILDRKAKKTEYDRKRAIDTPEQAKEAVENTGFITKAHTARTKSGRR